MSDALPKEKWSDLPAEGESIFGTPKRPAKPDYKIDPDTGCWEWLKAKSSAGYPWKYAHRLYFQRANPGVDITGLHVHHECHNRACVNPAHLSAVTPSKHLRSHGRSRSRLTEQDVVEIRASPQTIAQLAVQYGVDHGVIANILCGPDWPGVGTRTKPIRHCLGCGEVIPQERNRNTVYCGLSCKVRKRWADKTPEQKAEHMRYQREYRARKRAERQQQEAA